MFYFFSKTLSYLLTPAGWLFVALVAAFFTKKTLLRQRIIGVALLVFYILGNSFLVNEWALLWEYPPAAIPKDSRAKVAVVLTGGMINVSKETPDKRFLLSHQADRAGQALYLYKTGAVQKILISGGSGNLPFQRTEVNDEGRMVAQFLMIAGVRAGDIVLENKSRNTHENAMFSGRMLRQHFPKYTCVLVTSAFHMRRAVACFQKEHIAVIPFPGSFMSTRRSFMPGEWLFPHEESFAYSYYLTKELVGYLAYAVAGYV